MDTREVHAQHTIEMLERVATIAASRNVSKPTTSSARSLCMQTHRAPHSSKERNAWIAEAAYFIGMHRGFSPGHELDDWLTAENEVATRLMGAPREY
jgi:hypothetical protein